jgi:hypothetical protein
MLYQMQYRPFSSNVLASNPALPVSFGGCRAATVTAPVCIIPLTTSTTTPSSMARHIGSSWSRRHLRRNAHQRTLRATMYVDVPASVSMRQLERPPPLCNGREEARHFFPQIRDRLAIAREMPQQTSLEESIEQRIKGGPGDGRLSAAK